MRQRIRNEVELTTMLESPSIIKCREIIEDNENMALILELLPGGDLKSSIMDLGSIPSAEAMRIMEQLLDGLDAAHGQESFTAISNLRTSCSPPTGAFASAISASPGASLSARVQQAMTVLLNWP
jgi:serine/threonine protein kinase